MHVVSGNILCRHVTRRGVRRLASAKRAHRASGFESTQFSTISYLQRCQIDHQVGGKGAVSSTVASTKQTARMIQHRGSVLLARSDVGGRIDFGSPAGNGRTRPSTTSGSGIEMASRIGIRKSSVSGRISSRSSGVEVDTYDTNLQGGSATGTIDFSVSSKTKTSAVGRVEAERPDAPVNTTGLASTAPTSFGGLPSLPPLPAETRRQNVRFQSIDGDNVDVSGTTSHVDSPGLTMQLAPEIPAQVTSGGPATGVQVEGSGRSDAQPPSRVEHLVNEGRRDYTVAARTGNFLAELPLSKLKIVIGKPTHNIRRITLYCIQCSPRTTY